MEECHQMKAAIRVRMIVVPMNLNTHFNSGTQLDVLSSELTSMECVWLQNILRFYWTH